MKKVVTLATMLAIVMVFAAPALAAHLTGFDIQNGNNGDNLLRGNGDRDALGGLGGDDALYGGGGGDFIDADSNDLNTVRGKGGDLVRGGAGPDDIYGGPKGDALYGQGGNDFINDGNYRDMGAPTRGDNSRDAIYCGPGFDTVRAEPIDFVARDCEDVTRRP